MTDIKGSFKDDSYTWAEDRPGGGGGGPRSMKIMGPGIAQGGLLWGVDPNPHANGAYNDGGQQKLYDGFVKQIDQGWPTKGKASFTKVKEDGDIPDKTLKAKMLKMKKPEQVKAIENFNKEGEAAAEEDVKKKYVEAVLSHLQGKKGKAKFTLGSETYTLG